MRRRSGVEGDAMDLRSAVERDRRSVVDNVFLGDCYVLEVNRVV